MQRWFIMDSLGATLPLAMVNWNKMLETRNEACGKTGTQSGPLTIGNGPNSPVKSEGFSF